MLFSLEYLSIFPFDDILLLIAPINLSFIRNATKITPYHFIKRSEQATISTIYKMRNITGRIARNKNHLIFLARCKKHNLIPRGLRVTLPIKTTRAASQAIKTSYVLLGECTKMACRKEIHLQRERQQLHPKVLLVLDQEEFRQMEKWINEYEERCYHECREKQLKKFDTLILESQQQLATKKLVKNYSSRQLDKIEEEVLALGLNFAITPKAIPTQEIVTRTEAISRTMNANQAQDLKSRVKWCLKHCKQPKTNLTRQQMKAIQRLKGDETIKILPADKGRTTVILDSTEYHQKMEGLLQDGTYKKLKNDPTLKITKGLNQMLRKLEDKHLMDRNTRLKLAPSQNRPPQMYGLPKIHKPDRPMRPIVSSIGSPTY